MIRFVILEGWDEVGKTTLARYLCNALRYPYVHIGAPNGDRRDEEEHHQAVNLPCAVIDRGWWSNRIYAPLEAGRKPMALETVRWLELAAADCAMVLVDCDPATLAARLRHADAWSDLLPPARALAHVRRTLAGTRVPPRRRFVYWTGSEALLPAQAWGTVLSHPAELVAELRLLSAAYPGWRTHGVGNPYLAQAALVGDRHPRGGRPFERSRSGTYLLRALEERAWTTDDLYITNAWHNPALADELRFIGRNGRPIVALGEEAQNVCQFEAFTSDPLRHPQFWSRFRHHRIGDYAARLGAALGFGPRIDPE